MRVCKQYNDDFRSDAVRLVRRGDRTLKQVAEDLGMNHWTLRGWYKRSDMAKRSKNKSKAVAAAAPADETAEQRVARLERENAALKKRIETLEMDREILKKAAAFFAKESE
jgi:transposase